MNYINHIYKLFNPDLFNKTNKYNIIILQSYYFLYKKISLYFSVEKINSYELY